VYWPGKIAIPTGSVCFVGSESTRRAKKNSFYERMNTRIAAV
jgi:hypothetical protein